MFTVQMGDYSSKPVLPQGKRKEKRGDREIQLLPQAQCVLTGECIKISKLRTVPMADIFRLVLNRDVIWKTIKQKELPQSTLIETHIIDRVITKMHSRQSNIFKINIEQIFSWKLNDLWTYGCSSVRLNYLAVSLWEFCGFGQVMFGFVCLFAWYQRFEIQV